jgi:drug/metabolite transporter (DMT)-like permease
MELTTLIVPWLWVIFTLVAALSQTLRNALQHDLTKILGTAGATHVRFLFGLPFACLFFVGVTLQYGLPPVPDATILVWTLLGAVAQILATALMLTAMQHRSFVVTIAFIKTEPVQVALFALVFLGEAVSLWLAIAILVATCGVIILSTKKNAGDEMGAKPLLLGVGAGALFALSAVGFRGAIRAVDTEFFVLAATNILVMGLFLQTLLVGLWLKFRSPETVQKILANWRFSLGAGFLGAFASQMWFLAFALESVAKIRTLALVEVLFAGLISRRLFSQTTSRREYIGIVLIVAGVIILLNTQ